MLGLPAAAAGILACSFGTSEPAQPDIDYAQQGTIVFTSAENLISNLNLIRADGADRRLLTKGGSEGGAAVSPDGRRIAFASARAVVESDIYVMNVDGTGQTNITRTFDLDQDEQTPKWSPDGTQVIFGTRAGTGSSAGEIYVMNADGSGRRRLSRADERAFSAGWSPDGKQIVYAAALDESGRTVLYIMQADGTNPRLLYDDNARSFTPAWSPDGKTIVFASRARGRSDSQIFVIKPDGSGLKQLTTGSGARSTPAWSPDSKAIAFTHQVSISNADIYVMAADGSNPRQVTADPAYEEEPAWLVGEVEIAGIAPPVASGCSNESGGAVRSTLRVTSRVGSGSAFLVANDLAVTAEHVVESSPLVTLTYADASTGTGRVAYRDRGQDLAIIRLDRPKPGLALSWGEPDALYPEQSLFIVGYPETVQGPVGLVTRGATHGVFELDETQIVQVDILAAPGNSGGPLVDDCGRVVGVVTQYASGLEVLIAVSVNEIRAEVERLLSLSTP
jgi:dipeptidyl aminopeptidase/acylaminoacyl peptidase